MQSKNKTAIVTGEYRKIKQLLKLASQAKARDTLLEPELHISHSYNSKAGHCMYPDWWGHEEPLRTPTETFMESKIASVSISNDQRSYGKPTSHDPPAKIVSTPYPKRMVDEIIQTDEYKMQPTSPVPTKIPVSVKDVKTNDVNNSILTESYCYKSPARHVPRQSELLQKPIKYMIPTVDLRSPPRTQKNTPTTPVRSKKKITSTSRTPTTTKKSTRNSPESITSKPPLTPFISKPPPENGIYSIVEKFLNGPIVSSLRLQEIDQKQLSIAQLVEGIKPESLVK